MKPEKVMEAYTYSLSDKHIDALMGSVGTSLEEMGLAPGSEAGLFGSKTAFAPSKEAHQPGGGYGALRAAGGRHGHR